MGDHNGSLDAPTRHEFGVAGGIPASRVPQPGPVCDCRYVLTGVPVDLFALLGLSPMANVGFVSGCDMT